MYVALSHESEHFMQKNVEENMVTKLTTPSLIEKWSSQFKMNLLWLYYKSKIISKSTK